MAEFMAEAHEKRLEAMDKVKEEVQRGYEQQIADLQSKVACVGYADVSAEPLFLLDTAATCGSSFYASESIV